MGFVRREAVAIAAALVAAVSVGIRASAQSSCPVAVVCSRSPMRKRCRLRAPKCCEAHCDWKSVEFRRCMGGLM